MRPLRFLLSLIACITAFFLVLFFGPWRASPQVDFEENTNIGAYFSWRTPSSLFPPSAIISLTDDNSTFFLARPAAFGPLVPSTSLSGQLWIGSGFGDDHPGHGGPGGSFEGELGCSDVPGWNDGEFGSIATAKYAEFSESRAAVPDVQSTKQSKRSSIAGDNAGNKKTIDTSAEDDGTDDHLYHPLSLSGTSKTNKVKNTGSAKKGAHADIQSLQESAEIAGKVVLLSRGGCGFLEKVKWAQRRGGVAVVIGDDIRGGPLVTMYARGDTSNVTIPALFTSHTTAHLLSSLMPSGKGSYLSPEEAARLGLAFGDKEESSRSRPQDKRGKEKAKSPAAVAAVNPAETAKAYEAYVHSRSVSGKHEADGANAGISGWLWSKVQAESNAPVRADSRRPPSSGNLEWVVEAEFDDEDGPPKDKKVTSGKSAIKKKPGRGSSDGFVIGVQDWRDSDLVAEQKEKRMNAGSTKASHSTKPTGAGSKGNSIFPGSGEYGKVSGDALDISKKPNNDESTASSTSKNTDNSNGGSRNWLGRWMPADWESTSTAQAAAPTRNPKSLGPLKTFNPVHMHDIHVPHAAYDEPTDHDGLWVTLTPTSMSSSPFFDTLLVLVVSPLVTLTVVYALLLLRARIRRRRWRAPKSIVERLPVRTYQTMVSTPSTSTTSSVSTPTSASTPLLNGTSPRPVRPRPRSRTTSEVPAQAGSSLQTLEDIEEKRSAGLAEWRRKYGGKQRECVVCLEEYVDGVSRVMSLPCGHEFHEGCITPWLTTRRRTCPICKGDVVRSLARSHGSSSASARIEEEDEDVIQQQASLLTNDDPASQGPISRDDDAFEDLERGMAGEFDRDR